MDRHFFAAKYCLGLAVPYYCGKRAGCSPVGTETRSTEISQHPNLPQASFRSSPDMTDFGDAKRECQTSGHVGSRSVISPALVRILV